MSCHYFTGIDGKCSFFNPHKKVDNLDGNGSLYLALQDISMKNGMFLQEVDALIGKVS